MKYRIIFFILAGFFYLTCQAGDNKMRNNFNIEDISGTWKSEPRNTEWGGAIFKISFIEKENTSELLGIDDIKNINNLVDKIKKGGRKEYQYVKEKLNSEGNKSIANFNKNEEATGKAVVKNLNEVLLDYSFYKDNPFDYFHLNEYMEKFVLDGKNQKSLIEVNKLLLGSIFPDEIIGNHNRIIMDVFLKKG